MKSLMMVAIVIGTIFILQTVDSEAALLSKQIEIQMSSVKHGPNFGDGWSEEQKEVWNMSPNYIITVR